jgi:hypothetical protein
LGILFRDSLPDHHQSAESKETVKLGMGLVATMSALEMYPLDDCYVDEYILAPPGVSGLPIAAKSFPHHQYHETLTVSNK